MKYLTTPSILEQPFAFHLVKIRGRQVGAQRMELALPDAPLLVDAHVHTHFGYCAVDVHPVPVAERAEALGLKGVVCLEHAGQLYLSPDDFWARRHVDDPDALRRAREAGVDRIAAYRDAMFRFRSSFMRVGLEVECDLDGKINLLEEDRHGWDVLGSDAHALRQVADLQPHVRLLRQIGFPLSEVLGLPSGERR